MTLSIRQSLPVIVFSAVAAGISLFMYSAASRAQCDFVSWFFLCSLPSSSYGLIALSISVVLFFALGVYASYSISRSSFHVPIPIIFFLSLLATLMLPFASRDIGYYWSAGQATLAGINVFTDIRPAFGFAASEAIGAADGFSYGPIAASIFALFAFFSGGSIAVFSIFWKIFSLVLYGAFLFVFGRAYRAFHGTDRGYALLFAIQPLLLFEWLGNGHFDALWLVPLILAILAAQDDSFVAASAYLSFGIWAKFLPALFVPWFVLWWADRARHKTRRQVILECIGIISVFVFISVIAWAPYWKGFAVFNAVAIQSKWAVSSIFFVLYHAIKPLFVASFGAQFHWYLTRVVQGALLALCLYVIYPILSRFAWLHSRGPIPAVFYLQAMTLSVFMYVALWQKSFWPWYAVWLVAMLVLAFGDRLRSVSSWLMAAPFVFYPVAFLADRWFSIDAASDPRIAWVVVFAVWSYPLYYLMRSRFKNYELLF